jgi:hypothetical protein
MGWQVEWKLLSDRIAAILEVSQIYCAAVSTGNADTRAPLFIGRPGQDLAEITKDVILNAWDVYLRILRFRDAHESVLPSLARNRLGEMINDYYRRFPRPDDSSFVATFDTAIARVLALAVFTSEFSSLLEDNEASVRSLVDRAFLHLQRSIVADQALAARWRRAFKAKGERACEQLGAVHLLLFGIYAFKAGSAGEQTDLVLGRSVMPEEAERATEALVLTEWKVVKNDGELMKSAEEAYSQAHRYGSGSLAGFELQSRRYLVMISGEHLKMPSDRVDGAVTYEYKNLAVKPSTPSRRARRS